MNPTRDRSHLTVVRGCGYVPSDADVDATGAPPLAPVEALRVGARMCDELAGAAEMAGRLAAAQLDALSRGDQLATVRTAIELQQYARLIAGHLGALHTVLDEAGAGRPVGGA